ncbi:hypothetical protein LZD48_15480, partial [Oceanobacillus sp. APA_J-2(6-2)]
FALMAVNLRKFTAKNSKKINNDDKFLSKKNPSRILMTWILFLLFLASYVPASFCSRKVRIMEGYFGASRCNKSKYTD